MGGEQTTEVEHQRDFTDEEFSRYLNEIDEGGIEVELNEQPDEKLADALNEVTSLKAQLEAIKQTLLAVEYRIIGAKEDVGEGVTIPYWLIGKSFNFKMVNGHLTLMSLNAEYWDATRLYLLLLYKYREIGETRMQISINYMKKGLGIRNAAIHDALMILKRGKLIKTRQEGQKTHAIKHYVTMLKVG